jgi:catechol 2,3-dioxygenase-like lactoylglutathione lyase family enzyme
MDDCRKPQLGSPEVPGIGRSVLGQQRSPAENAACSNADERKRVPPACWDNSGVIGRLEKTVIDCPDPRSLADFYCQVLGMRVNEDIGDWVVIGLEPGLRQLAFQRAAGWAPPRWPNPAYPQQLHLDIRVRDADQAEQELLGLGATRIPGERETGFRVFADPVGHPFCIVFGRHDAS